MKSFKEYLAEREGNEWDFNIPKTKKFYSQPNNIRKAQNVLQDMKKIYDKNGPDAIHDISTGSSGEETSDLLSALYVMNHVATVKDTAARKEMVGTGVDKEEAVELLKNIGFDPTREDRESQEKMNAVINKGKKIVKKKIEPDNSSEEIEKEEKETPDQKNQIDNKEEEAEEEAEEESEEEAEEEENKNNEKDTSPEKSNKPSVKDVDFEEENEKSPAYWKNKAEEEWEDLSSSLNDKIDEYNNKGDESRAKKLEKVLSKVNASARKHINRIEGHQSKFSDHPTSSSRAKARIAVSKEYRDMKKEFIEFKAEIRKSGYSKVGERLVNKKNVAASKMKDTLNNIKNSKAGQGTARAANRIKDSQAGDSVKRNAEKIASKASGATAKVLDKATDKALDKETYSKAYNKGKDILNKGKEKASSAYSKGKSNIKDSFQKRKEKEEEKKKTPPPASKIKKNADELIKPKSQKEKEEEDKKRRAV